MAALTAFVPCLLLRVWFSSPRPSLCTHTQQTRRTRIMSGGGEVPLTARERSDSSRKNAFIKGKTSDKVTVCHADGIITSNVVSHLTLAQAGKVLDVCERRKFEASKDDIYPGLKKVCEHLLELGSCSVVVLFQHASPKRTYRADEARALIASVPVLFVKEKGDPGKGGQKYFAYPRPHGGPDDVKAFAAALRKVAERGAAGAEIGGLDQATLKSLTQLCNGTSAKRLLMVAVVEAQGLSATQARQRYGIEGYKAKLEAVKENVKEVNDLAPYSPPSPTRKTLRCSPALACRTRARGKRRMTAMTTTTRTKKTTIHWLAPTANGTPRQIIRLLPAVRSWRLRRRRVWRKPLKKTTRARACLARAAGAASGARAAAAARGARAAGAARGARAAAAARAARAARGKIHSPTGT
jgi:hypothetical protein